MIFRDLGLNNKSLIFDIGANIGDKSALFSDTGASVIAFEPQKSCFEALQKRFKNNPKVKLENCALGRTVGIVEMKITSASTICSLSNEFIAATSKGRFADYKWDKVEKVQVLLLRSMISKYGIPNFIKIDVEGFEAEVLSSLTTKKGITAISCEFTPELLKQGVDAIEKLMKLGFNRFNYDNRSLDVLMGPHLSGHKLIDYLRTHKWDYMEDFGDVYAIAS